jgi:hypothetical protein
MAMTNYAKLLADVTSLIKIREGEGWSRQIGAGFIKEDIQKIHSLLGEKIVLVKTGDEQGTFWMENLNLRELDELAKWLKEKNDQH